MKIQRTSVGLDVHARSVVGCALDGDTGEVFQRRLTPDHGEIVAWLGDLPGPVAVTYEAGPTGFGLARALTAAGIGCEVAAPSKLIRPAGDRVKTDVRDAAHLARLLHLGQITAVTVPTATQEAARDLVRAREDCRGDLMTARHRVSKLLLRQGIVYFGGKAWTGRHEAWLRTQRFDNPALQLSYDAAFDAMLACLDRRNRLDEAITALAADSEFTPVVHRLGCIRGVATLTAFGLAVEIGDWHRLTGRTIGAYRRVGAQRVLLGRSPEPGRGDQDRQRPRPPPAGRSGLAPPRPSTEPGARAAAPLGSGLTGGPGPRPGRQPASAYPLGRVSTPARNARSSPTSRSPVNWPAGVGHWQSCPTDPHLTTVQMNIPLTGRQASWSDPRYDYEQSCCPTTDDARR